MIVDYEPLDSFICAGKHMATVRIGKNVHVVETWELKHQPENKNELRGEISESEKRYY